MLSTPILVLSLLATLLAILVSLRVVRDTGWKLPWMLTAGALLAISARRLLDLDHTLDPGGGDLDPEISLAFAVLVLLGVQAIERLVREVRQLRYDKKATEETFESLVANLPMAASVSYPDGGVRFLNPAQIVALTGHGPEEGASLEFWLSLVHPDDQPEVGRARARVLAGETVRVEGRIRHTNGKWRTFETLLYPHSEGDEVTAVHGLTSDVTERRFLEEQLRRSQKMEALGAMGGGIAHDFNNLLAGILGNVELAARKLEPDHLARKYLDDAARATLRATEHTRQILGFSRRSVLNPRAVDLNDVCREAVTLVRPTVDPRIEFVVRTEPDLWETIGDPGEVVQLLVNLLLNARDVLLRGGLVLLEATNVVLDETYTRSHAEARPGEFVLLTVTDDGPGMAPEVRSRIFEPFFTTKAAGQGTGLGLAMVYGTIRRHGGWVNCYSEQGQGTRFSLYFPRGAPAAATESLTPSQDAVPGGTETVLLVEDEEALRTVGVEALQELGYCVLTARDGVEAVEVFRHARSRIRLVILDLSMPRMNGRDALARLREIDPRVRVLLTSGHAHEAQALLGNGAVGFVGKPYRLAEMGWAVRTALDG